MGLDHGLTRVTELGHRNDFKIVYNDGRVIDPNGDSLGSNICTLHVPVITWRKNYIFDQYLQDKIGEVENCGEVDVEKAVLRELMKNCRMCVEYYDGGVKEKDAVAFIEKVFGVQDSTSMKIKDWLVSYIADFRLTFNALKHENFDDKDTYYKYWIWY